MNDYSELKLFSGLVLLLIGFVGFIYYSIIFALNNPELTVTKIVIENWMFIGGFSVVGIYGWFLGHNSDE